MLILARVEEHAFQIARAEPFGTRVLSSFTSVHFPRTSSLLEHQYFAMNPTLSRFATISTGKNLRGRGKPTLSLEQVCLLLLHSKGRRLIYVSSFYNGKK
jgi:hypothetical protein